MSRFDSVENVELMLLMTKAFGLWQGGKYEDALAGFERAISIDGSNVDAWMGKGMAYDGLGRHEDALESYDRSTQIDPDYEKVWYNKALTYEAAGQLEQALLCCDRALALDRNYERAYLKREDLLKKLDRCGISVDKAHSVAKEAAATARLVRWEDLTEPERHRIEQATKAALERVTSDRVFAQAVVEDPLRALREYDLPAAEVHNLGQMARIHLLFPGGSKR